MNFLERTKFWQCSNFSFSRTSKSFSGRIGQAPKSFIKLDANDVGTRVYNSLENEKIDAGSIQWDCSQEEIRKKLL